jgi:hypothetical protein
MPPEGFEPTILASERPQTHASYGAATGIGKLPDSKLNLIKSAQTVFKKKRRMKQTWGN